MGVDGCSTMLHSGSRYGHSRWRTLQKSTCHYIPPHMGEAPLLPGLYDGRSLAGGMCCTQARYADTGHDRKAESNGEPWKESLLVPAIPGMREDARFLGVTTSPMWGDHKEFQCQEGRGTMGQQSLSSRGTAIVNAITRLGSNGPITLSSFAKYWSTTPGSCEPSLTC